MFRDRVYSKREQRKRILCIWREGYVTCYDIWDVAVAIVFMLAIYFLLNITVLYQILSDCSLFFSLSLVFFMLLFGSWTINIVFPVPKIQQYEYKKNISKLMNISISGKTA